VRVIGSDAQNILPVASLKKKKLEMSPLGTRYRALGQRGSTARG